MLKQFPVTAFGIWIVNALIAVLNGIFRNAFITPWFGEHTGHIISTAILIIVLSAIIYLYVSRILWPCPVMTLVTIGFVWLVLTVGFEFAFGHYIVGHPWELLLADYNIFRGRIWVLVLVTQVTAPVISGLFLKK